jgi:hypothetical protein
MDGEHTGQPGDGTNPQHLVLRRGEQQVAPGLPGLLPGEDQGSQAAGIDELQAPEVDD